MPIIKFKGFSPYHERKVCSITFLTEYDRVKFETNFNGNFSGPQVMAELEQNSLTVNITYTNEVSDNEIRHVVNKLL